MLSRLLHTLQQDGVVHVAREGRATTYELTVMGHELAQVCLLLGVWGARWLEDHPENQDPCLALWTIARLIEPGSLPRDRVVVRFDVSDARTHDRFWLVVDGTGAEVCIEPPGLIEDGLVLTGSAALIRWYAGQRPALAARPEAEMTVSAPVAAARAGQMGTLNPYAGVTPARLDPSDQQPGTGLAAAAAAAGHH